MSTDTLAEFELEIREFASILLDLDEWNRVQYFLWDAIDEAALNHDIEMVNELSNLQYATTVYPQLLSQINEFIEENVEVNDILDMVDIDNYVEIIDPFVTTSPSRRVDRSASTWNSSTTTVAATQHYDRGLWHFSPVTSHYTNIRFRFPSQHIFNFSSFSVLSTGPQNQAARLEFTGTHFPPGSGASARVTFAGTFTN